MAITYLTTQLKATAIIIVFLCKPLHADNLKKLTASIGHLPFLSSKDSTGLTFELIKVLDMDWSEGSIEILPPSPFTRSIENVIKGKADFHFPLIRVNQLENSEYRYISVNIGKVPFVIYSNKSKIVTRNSIDNAKEQLLIETERLHASLFNFYTTKSNNIEGSLRRVSKGRIDAYIFAQYETDKTIVKYKIKNIHRSLYQYYPATIVVKNNKHGRQVDIILSKIINRVKNKDIFIKLNKQVQPGYKDWQPAQ